MGPEENNTAETLYFKSEDHGCVQIPSNILPFLELECDDEEAYKRAIAIRSTDSFTFTIHMRKNNTRMSAKRFKKILISKGLSRDNANFLCCIIGYYKGKVSYLDVCLKTLFLYPFVRGYDIFNYIVTKGEAK